MQIVYVSENMLLTVILFRYVTAGGDDRPLCTEDPLNDTIIPTDEMAWTGGVCSITPFRSVLYVRLPISNTVVGNGSS